MSNKHLPHDLKQMQSLPLESKIAMTQQRIRQWYNHWEGNVYVSFSGGKDSTVLKHIVDGIYSDVPAVFVNTGLEFPEIQKFARNIKAGMYDCFNADVEIIRPEMRFDEVIKTYGYPVVSKSVALKIQRVQKARAEGRQSGCMKFFDGVAKMPNGKKSKYNIAKWKYLLNAEFDISNICCDVMKKAPANQYYKDTGRMPIIGTLAAESMTRYDSWLKNGCNAFHKKKPSSQPLSFWTEQDILHYIKKYSVPYCSVYGDIVIDDNAEIEGQINLIDVVGEYGEADKLKTTGCDRTGCIFCMFGCHLEKSPNRFQRLKETHPKQYQYCIGGGEMVDGKWQPNKQGLGLGKILEYIGVDYD